MTKLTIVLATAVVVMICAAIWVSQQMADAPTSETAFGQVDTTNGQDMRPRWVDNGGQGDGAGS